MEQRSLDIEEGKRLWALALAIRIGEDGKRMLRGLSDGEPRVGSYPVVLSLQECGLAEVVDRFNDVVRWRITDLGRIMLGVLGGDSGCSA